MGWYIGLITGISFIIGIIVAIKFSEPIWGFIGLVIGALIALFSLFVIFLIYDIFSTSIPDSPHFQYVSEEKGKIINQPATKAVMYNIKEREFIVSWVDEAKYLHVDKLKDVYVHIINEDSAEPYVRIETWKIKSKVISKILDDYTVPIYYVYIPSSMVAQFYTSQQ